MVAWRERSFGYGQRKDSLIPGGKPVRRQKVGEGDVEEVGVCGRQVVKGEWEAAGC